MGVEVTGIGRFPKPPARSKRPPAILSKATIQEKIGFAAWKSAWKTWHPDKDVSFRMWRGMHVESRSDWIKIGEAAVAEDRKHR